MRRTLLFAVAVGAFSGVSAQRSTKQLPLSVKHQAVAYRQPGEMQFSQVYNQGSQAARNGGNQSTLATVETVIGTSTYPLQTNSSTLDRIVFNSDNTISATWTFSNGGWNTWADRGTGYAYYNGTSWSTQPTARIENDRTGFTNILVLGNNSEFVNSHNTNLLCQHFNIRATKGTGTWTDNTTLISQPSGFTYGTFWPRLALGGASGDVIHHISISAPTGLATGGGPYTNGQDGALLYSRSNDAGASFAVQNVVLTAFDETQEVGYGADSYSIDASGNTVAIVAGGFGNDVVLAKSTDGGQNWTKTIVQDFPIALFDDQITDIDSDGVADTLETNDASLSVLIDNSGMVHIWYGKMRIMNDDNTDGVVSYFPGTAVLMYWNENMGATPPMELAGAEDIDGNGVLDVADFGTYQTSLVSHPTSGIDAAGNIYLAFSSIIENTDDGTGKCLRNIYAMKSFDQGQNWTTPYNIAPDNFVEKVYPSMARRVTTEMIVEYQVDPIAGHGVFTANNPDPENANTTNDIVVARVPVTDLEVGVNEHSLNESSVEIFPNPANDNATLAIHMNASQAVTITLINSIGQTVSSQTKSLTKGNNLIDLDVAGLSAGIYFVNVLEGTSMLSKKLIIQ
jgi:hypothetical protein